MKLYATIENENGKKIGLGSNESLKLTAYEGNYKQYEINIVWTDIGDIIDNNGNELPEKLKTKGSIITTREWRNEPKNRRKLKGEKCNCGFNPGFHEKQDNCK